MQNCTDTDLRVPTHPEPEKSGEDEAIVCIFPLFCTGAILHSAVLKHNSHSNSHAHAQDPVEDAAAKSLRAQSEELAAALNPFPRCKHLIQLYRTALKIPNKTPLAILHEYATRLNLEVSAPTCSLSCCDRLECPWLSSL